MDHNLHSLPNMHTSPSSFFLAEEYIRAAPDAQLSSANSNLLTTLLKQEDQYEYSQLLDVSLPVHVHHLLQQLSSLLHLSSSTTWMATLLLKKLAVEQHSLDVLVVLASVTLAHKYQDASQSIDYELLAQCCCIDSTQLIHDAEVDLLESLSYDITVTTPDHFFSYLSNLDSNSKHVVEQAQSLLLPLTSSSPDTFELMHQYPCSIVVLSLMCTVSSDAFVIGQIKSFAEYKKDRSHYLNQLLHCTAQLRHVLSQ